MGSLNGVADSTDPRCDQHVGAALIPDTFGYWYCPDCDDEAHAARINKGPAPARPEALD